MLYALITIALARPLTLTVYDPKLPDPASVEVIVRAVDGSVARSTVGLGPRSVANDGLRYRASAVIDVPEASPWHITVALGPNDEDARWVAADTASFEPDPLRTRYLDLDGVPIPGLGANLAGELRSTNADGRVWFRAARVILPGGAYVTAKLPEVSDPNANLDVVVSVRRADLVQGSRTWLAGDEAHYAVSRSLAFPRWLPVGESLELAGEGADARTRHIQVPASGPVTYGDWAPTPEAPDEPEAFVEGGVEGGVIGGQVGGVVGGAYGGVLGGGVGPRTVHASEVHWKEQVVPKFPAEALVAGLASPVTCRVRVFLDERGAPTDVVFVACPEALQAETRAAVMASRADPVRLGGPPEPVQFLLVYRFTE